MLWQNNGVLMFKLGAKDMERVHLGTIDRHFYITGPIEDEEDYLDLIDALYSGKPTETIIIHLNTPGGRLDITMQILNALAASEADVITIADGEVASAGSLILFASSQIAVQPFSYVMIHDGSGGNLGKINENLKQAQFIANLTASVYKKIYQPFFTEEEVNAILDGKDMWLTSEEVNERIKKVANKGKEENAEV